MGTSLVTGLSWQATRCYRDEAVSLLPAMAGSTAAASTRCGGRRVPGDRTGACGPAARAGACGPAARAGARPGHPSGRARVAVTAPPALPSNLCWLLGMVYLT